MKCKYHSCQNEIGEGSTKAKIFCSIKCKSKFFVDKNRWTNKLKAIGLLGGECSICGYKKLPHALEFHHKDPNDKSFEISHPHTRSWDKIKAEVLKCELVCSNCHKEIEFDKLEHKKDFFLEIFKDFNMRR